MPVIDIRDFAMRFGAKEVIRDLSFEVREGETFGLLGSNGSGKTTTLRALLGLYTPTAGTLLVDGRPFDPGDQGRHLGYLPEERGLYAKEPVLAVMTYFGQLKGMPKTTAKAWSQQYLERVGLADRAGVRLNKLSGGQQQKVQLGVTIMNKPAILILDEPTKGFDPVNRRLLMDLVEEQRQAGATVVIITHQMDEVERLCDRILLLKDGVAEAYGTIPQVQDRFSGRTARIRFRGRLPHSELFTVALREANYAELTVREGVDNQQVLGDLLAAGVQLDGFHSTRISMEEIFLRVYGSHGQAA